VLRAAGEEVRRNDPFVLVEQILGTVPGGQDPGDAAFDFVDELSSSGPVVLGVDDAHQLDGASLTVLRRAGLGEPEPSPGRLISMRQHTSSKLPQLVLGAAVPVVIIVYMLKFSQSYPDRVTQALT
jgi:hypothetical protein